MTQPGPSRTDSTSRRVVGALALALAAAALGLAATPAVAAPAFDVDVVRDMPVVSRSDQRVEYDITVSNQAPNTVEVGDPLTCDPASWFFSPSFSYQWVRDGVSLGAANGAQTDSYVIQPGDAGHSVQCIVLGTNAVGAAASFSDPAVVPPVPSPAPPTWDSTSPRPTISPRFQDASFERTCEPPTNWTGSPSWSYQWLRNGQPIPGATSATYQPVSPDDDLTVIQCQVIGQTGTGSPPGGGAAIAISETDSTLHPSLFPDGSPPNNNIDRTVVITPNHVHGTVTAEVELPAGHDSYVYEIGSEISGQNSNDGWSCDKVPAVGAEPAKAVCTRSGVLAPGGSFPPLKVAVALGADAPDDATVTATAAGGGAPPASGSDQFVFAPFIPFGIESFETPVLDAPGGNDYTQAGGHPFSAGANFTFNTHRILPKDAHTLPAPIEYPSTTLVDVPAGFVGNLLAVPTLCHSVTDVVSGTCPEASRVGGIELTFGGLHFSGAFSSIYAVEPAFGHLAQFSFADPFGNIYNVFPKLRPGAGYAIRLQSTAAPVLPLIDVKAQLCGFGATREPSGAFQACKQAGDPGANPVPFLSLPNRCEDTPPTTRLAIDSWEHPGAFAEALAVSPTLTGCDQVSFDPSIDFDPSSSEADSPTGLDVDLALPSDGLESPGGVAEGHLRGAHVTLPEGMTVNASAADGLDACSSDQIGLGTDDPVECPDGSKVGSATVKTPVLADTFHGSVYLARQHDNPFDSLLALYLVVESKERGLLVKIPGKVTPDPVTGQLTAVFDDNPQLPLSDVTLSFDGGPRASLKTPPACGSYGVASTLSSWSAPFTPDVLTTSPFDVDQGCGTENSFNPGFTAGVTHPEAGGFSPFVARITRGHGKELGAVDMRLPKGSLAALRDVAVCGEGQLAGSESKAGKATQQGSVCPAGSRVGSVTVGAGAGPLYYPKIPGSQASGRMFLTGPQASRAGLSAPEGAREAAYGMAIEVPAVAGPFDLGTVLVRAAIFVDPKTAEITVRSEKVPRILEGIPLDVRDVRVNVDRARFTTTPTSCLEKQVGARIHAQDGTTASKSDRFQVDGCDKLRFKPRLALRLTGRRQTKTGGHPGVKALVRQSGLGEAGIGKARVALPSSLALDPDNAQALCEYTDGTRPDLESHCPKGSIVGRAKATSPLLKHPVAGNVYFVKNVRIDKDTGNQIRTLPMLVVALRGEVAVNLYGQSSTTKAGKLVNTFAGVPDAPIGRFDLNIRGGRNGILTVTRTERSTINLCALGRQTAQTTWNAQNGDRRSYKATVKTPCATQPKHRLELKRRKAKAQRRAAAGRHG